MRPALALGVLATLVASGCSSVERDAASVGGTVVTVEQFETLLSEFAARPEITNLQEDPATGSVPSADARNWLTLLVRNAASTEFLAENDEAVTDEDRQTVRDTIEADSDLLQFPDEIVSQFVDLQAASTAQERIPAPDAAELERRYDRSPASLGVVCVRHVLLETEAEAQDVMDELAAGAAIEDLATERSTDPSAADNGGAIELATGACIPSADAAQQLDPTFVAAAMTSSPGEPVGPVQTSFGWHVIEARPYDEVSDSLTTLYDESAGSLLFDGFMATADIHVDPRYGRWDGTSASVVVAVSRRSVTIVGLGPGGHEHVTVETLRAIERIPNRFLRTARHPSADLVPDATTFDRLYESADRFEDVYTAITEAVVAGAIEHGEVLYAVPGSPFVLERSVRSLLADERVRCDVLPAMSFLDLVWARLGIDPIEAGVRLVDGHEFAAAAAGATGPLLIAHAHAGWVLSDIKLAAEEAAGDEAVVILQGLGTDGRADRRDDVERARPGRRGRPPDVRLRAAARVAGRGGIRAVPRARPHAARAVPVGP